MISAPRPVEARRRSRGQYPGCGGGPEAGNAPSSANGSAADCYPEPMRKRLPAAVLPLKPVEKLVWLYINDHPGEYSGAALSEALGVYSARALASLVELGLLVQEVAPTSRTPGKYRAVTLEPK